MPLLDWLDQDDLLAPGVYLIPIYKKQWGTFRVQAENEEHALTEFANTLITRVESDTEWLDYHEYEYDSCGVIERE